MLLVPQFLLRVQTLYLCADDFLLEARLGVTRRSLRDPWNDELIELHGRRGLPYEHGIHAFLRASGYLVEKYVS